MATSPTPDHSPRPHTRPWTWANNNRPDPASDCLGPPSAHRALAEDLEEQPVAFLVQAANALDDIGSADDCIIAELCASQCPVAAALGAGMHWLRHGAPPSVVDGLPLWLAELDRAQITHARRGRERPDLDTTSYLVELALADGRLGSFQARIDHTQDDALTNAFFTDDPIDMLERILGAATRNRRRLYRNIKPSTAVSALTAAAGRALLWPGPHQLANPWPRNRALLAFALGCDVASP